MSSLSVEFMCSRFQPVPFPTLPKPNVVVEHFALSPSSPFLGAQVDPPRSALIAVANRCGFELHRTQNGFVHLMKWLPDRKCMVPPYATHQVITSNAKI